MKNLLRIVLVLGGLAFVGGWATVSADDVDSVISDESPNDHPADQFVALALKAGEQLQSHEVLGKTFHIYSATTSSRIVAAGRDSNTHKGVGMFPLLTELSKNYSAIERWDFKITILEGDFADLSKRVGIPPGTSTYYAQYTVRKGKLAFHHWSWRLPNGEFRGRSPTAFREAESPPLPDELIKMFMP